LGFKPGRTVIVAGNDIAETGVDESIATGNDLCHNDAPKLGIVGNVKATLQALAGEFERMVSQAVVESACIPIRSGDSPSCRPGARISAGPIPAVVVPNGLRGNDAPKAPPVDDGEDDRIGGPGTPVSLTFVGPLYKDPALLAFALAYQKKLAFIVFIHPGLNKCGYSQAPESRAWIGSQRETTSLFENATVPPDFLRVFTDEKYQICEKR
jgi:hypothetical protein